MSVPANPSARGWFITLDGPEGGGKTTQARRLHDDLVTAGTPAILTREPGGTWLGERLRDVLLARTASTTPTDALTDAFLFNAARRQLVREVIRPAMDHGTTVVCARFADSTLAYQGYGAGVDLAPLRALADAATDGLAPDLTIILDVPVEVGLARKAPSDVTRFEAEFDIEFHGRVRAGFLELAADEPSRVVVIDATRSADEVAADVRVAIAERLLAGEPLRPPERMTG